LNRRSGSGDPLNLRETISEILTAAGREHHIRTVSDGRKMPEIAREVVALAISRGGHVVAAGGDGTINALAQAVLGTQCALGVLPQGTFNYFGRVWGIPEDAAGATRLLLGARPRPVQVGLVNGRVFLVNASLGLYPRLLEERESYKRQYGRSRLVALFAGIATLLREHQRIRLLIEHDGERQTVRTPTLFVGNNRLQLERIGIEEAPDTERGKLVAITPHEAGTRSLLWLLLRGIFGKLGEAGKVTSFSFERINVQRLGRLRRRRVRVATDGELNWLQPPLEFSVATDQLLFLAPDLPNGSDAST
jgi:diacylglycerol kinase family enzyme